MTSLIPMYLKTTYKDDPIFTNTRVIYSVAKNEFKDTLKKDFVTKLTISEDISKKHSDYFKNGDNTSLNIGGVEFADALIVGESLDEKVTSHVKKAGVHHQNDRFTLVGLDCIPIDRNHIIVVKTR